MNFRKCGAYKMHVCIMYACLYVLLQCRTTVTAQQRAFKAKYGLSCKWYDAWRSRDVRKRTVRRSPTGRPADDAAATGIATSSAGAVSSHKTPSVKSDARKPVRGFSRFLIPFQFLIIISFKLLKFI